MGNSKLKKQTIVGHVDDMKQIIADCKTPGKITPDRFFNHIEKVKKARAELNNLPKA